MSSLYLPPSVSRELRERTRSFNQDVLDSIELDAGDPILIEYTLRLQEIHPRLLMVRAKDRVVPGVPMKPGYYHVLVRSEGAPWSVSPVEGAAGEFAAPTSRVLEKIAAGDLRERRNLERFDRHAKAEMADNDADQARAKQERKQHLNDLIKTYTQTSVSVTDATPWRQNQAGHQHGGRQGGQGGRG